MRRRIARRAMRGVATVRRWIRRDRTRWAFAIGPDRIVAVELTRTLWGPRPARVLRRALDPPDDEGWPSLDAALDRLPAASRRHGGEAFVALLRPLARVKTLELPPVRAGDARALLRRNASRYFAFVDGEVVADARRYGSRRDPTVGVCAGAEPTGVVADRLRAAGFRVREVAAGPVALVEATRAWLPRARRGRLVVVARSGSGTELVALDRGAPRIFYPIPSGASAGAAAAEIAGVLHDAGRGRDVGRVVLIGDPTGREELRAALADRGVEVEPEDRSGRRGLTRFDADAVAAIGAARAPEQGPSLLPTDLRRRRDRRARRRTAALGIATAALVVLAALAHLWGLGRELDAVQARRHAISAGVRDALASRRALNAVRDRLASVARLERGRPGWTGLVADLARALPDSSHLRSFMATDSTLRISGSAASVAAVVSALEAAPAFGSVALAAPVRRAARDGRERFELTLRLADTVPAMDRSPVRSAAASLRTRP